MVNMNKYRMLSRVNRHKDTKLSRYAVIKNCLCRSIALNAKIFVNHKEYTAQNASYNIKRIKDGHLKRRGGGYLYNRRIVLFSLTEAARICFKRASKKKHKLETSYSKDYTSILKIWEVHCSPNRKSLSIIL